MHSQDHTTKALQAAAELLAGANELVVFTGAGVSQESGIDTFRDVGGLWDTFDMQTFGTPGGIAKLVATQPARLAAFVAAILNPIAAAEPNPGHRAIAQLEETHDVAVVTQNVDGLHQQAGSTLVREIHGSVHQIVDTRGVLVRRLTPTQLARLAEAMAAIKTGRLARWRLLRALKPLLRVGPTGIRQRPNLVLFGEQLAEPHWTQAQADVQSCDAMLVVGTSGEVFPAAALPEHVRNRGRPVVGVGPEEGEADVWLHGTAGAILPKLVAQVRALRGQG